MKERESVSPVNPRVTFTLVPPPTTPEEGRSWKDAGFGVSVKEAELEALQYRLEASELSQFFTSRHTEYTPGVVKLGGKGHCALDEVSNRAEEKKVVEDKESPPTLMNTHRAPKLIDPTGRNSPVRVKTFSNRAMGENTCGNTEVMVGSG